MNLELEEFEGQCKRVESRLEGLQEALEELNNGLLKTIETLEYNIGKEPCENHN